MTMLSLLGAACLCVVVWLVVSTRVHSKERAASMDPCRMLSVRSHFLCCALQLRLDPFRRLQD